MYNLQETFSFIITAYQQVELVERGIKRIRNEYPESLSHCSIIVVSTSEEDLFSSLLERYSNIYFVHFVDAPGNKNQEFLSRLNPASNYLNWRQEYLPPRIMMSIQKGLEQAEILGCKYALHLHSDTYWKPDKIYNLVEEIDILDNYLFIGDLSFPNEDSAKKNNVIPSGLHFQPEGLLFNLEKCRSVGYDKFENIWIDDNFKSHNFGSIEALFGQFAIYCLSNKKVNVTRFNDFIPEFFKKIVKIRTIRNYHGSFKSGIVNLELDQEKVKTFDESDLVPENKSLKNIIKGLIYRYEP